MSGRVRSAATSRTVRHGRGGSDVVRAPRRHPDRAGRRRGDPVHDRHLRVLAGQPVTFEFPPLPDPSTPGIGKFQRPGAAAETQREAALEAYPATGTWRRRVLVAIAETGGATDEEIQHHLRLNPSTERPRRVELVERGWIEDSGIRRRTSSGRSAVVWALTSAARNQFAQVEA